MIRMYACMYVCIQSDNERNKENIVNILEKQKGDADQSSQPKQQTAFQIAVSVANSADNKVC